MAPSEGVGHRRHNLHGGVNDDRWRYVTVSCASSVRSKGADRLRTRTAELLAPKVIVSTKRICVDTSYFETCNRRALRLVGVAAHHSGKICTHGLRTGTPITISAPVVSTRFRAMTNALTTVDIQPTEQFDSSKSGGWTAHLSRPRW